MGEIVSDKISKIIADLIYIEDQMRAKGFCDNNCKDENGNNCPFNRMADVCSLSRVIDELSSCYIDDDLTIGDEESE